MVLPWDTPAPGPANVAAPAPSPTDGSCLDAPGAGSHCATGSSAAELPHGPTSGACAVAHRRALGSLGEVDGLDVVELGCGTAYVSAWLARRGARPVGVDVTPAQLETARRCQAEHGLSFPLVEASADALPFPDASFDHLTFTYLLRYVDDPGSTLVELARVVRPGGTVAMLEFGLPHGVWRPPWNLWVDVGLPLAGRLVSPGWHEVGRFLGPSIRGFHERHPEPELLGLWRAAGIEDVRARHPSLGGGLLVWGRRGAG